MMPLAESSTALSRLQQIPSAVWLRIGIGLLGLVVAVIVLRKVLNMNKVVLAVIVLLVLSFVGFNWIYERNEPKWATPVVEKIATFFPSKGMTK